MTLPNIQKTTVGIGNVDGKSIKLSEKIFEKEEANAV